MADYFGKRHADVLRALESLGCSEAFAERNFALSAYKDRTGRSLKAYDMTRDGFTFLVFRFTGPEAARFTERYIERFEAMERDLKAAAVNLDNPAVLREILGKYAERVEAAEARVAELAPKAITPGIFDGFPRFIGKDVAEAMGYSKAKAADMLRGISEGAHPTRTLGDKEKVRVQTKGGPQPLWTISESALYRLAMRSDKPAVLREIWGSMRSAWKPQRPAANKAEG